MHTSDRPIIGRPYFISEQGDVSFGVVTSGPWQFGLTQIQRAPLVSNSISSIGPPTSALSGLYTMVNSTNRCALNRSNFSPLSFIRFHLACSAMARVDVSGY